MCIHERKGEGGLSLVELILGFGLVGLLLVALAGILTRAQTLDAQVRQQMTVQQWGYIVLDRLEKEIALAGLHLDGSAGEEAFPPLPAQAGDDWSRALAIQYRPQPGEPLRRVAWYLEDGRLWEAVSDEEPLPVTADSVRAEDLSVSYFTHENVRLEPARLNDARWRAQIRRISVSLSLAMEDATGTTARYPVRLAVVIQNPCR